VTVAIQSTTSPNTKTKRTRVDDGLVEKQRLEPMSCRLESPVGRRPLATGRSRIDWEGSFVAELCPMNR
jgi:hypothetical protein